MSRHLLFFTTFLVLTAIARGGSTHGEQAEKERCKEILNTAAECISDSASGNSMFSCSTRCMDEPMANDECHFFDMLSKPNFFIGSYDVAEIYAYFEECRHTLDIDEDTIEETIAACNIVEAKRYGDLLKCVGNSYDGGDFDCSDKCDVGDEEVKEMLEPCIETINKVRGENEQLDADEILMILLTYDNVCLEEASKDTISESGEIPESCKHDVVQMGQGDPCPHGFGFPSHTLSCKYAVEALGLKGLENYLEKDSLDAKLNQYQHDFARTPKCLWGDGFTGFTNTEKNCIWNTNDRYDDDVGGICIKCQSSCFGSCYDCDGDDDTHPNDYGPEEGGLFGFIILMIMLCTAYYCGRKSDKVVQQPTIMYPPGFHGQVPQPSMQQQQQNSGFELTTFNNNGGGNGVMLGGGEGAGVRRPSGAVDVNSQQQQQQLFAGMHLNGGMMTMSGNNGGVASADNGHLPHAYAHVLDTKNQNNIVSS